ncbi:MAG: MvaI/BcnI restriction endonuclease family protein [Candidatus Magnetomorum sp.]|nr:MvaI/BcnI restriction endonuclease family protein [Candidatus Magnetomorum sp.]
MEVYTKKSIINRLKEIRNKGWIPTMRKNNDGGVGNTLEDLLGIDENNLPLPNAAEWELKAQKKETTSLITLFHMEPSPRAFKFVPSILLPEFGWQHQEAGIKYSDNEKSFRQTINANMYSNRGFSVKVDRNEKKVLINFSPQKIDNEAHHEWANAVFDKRLDPQPYWGFDDLFHKVGTKLHNCFFVQAESKKIDGRLHFHYQDIFMLKSLDIDKFINAIQNGYVYIDFDARTGHNHGTKFRLKSKALINLYAEVKQY